VREPTAHEERRVREYVNSQSPPDDQVTLFQKIGTRKVLGRSHHLYDIRTVHGRWWVISDPLMNLYSQDDFHRLEMVLTYHIGVCAMLAERGRKEWGKPERGLDAGVWRRFERAVDAFNDADEAEAFQSVGVICREALLALVRAEAKRVILPADEAAPKVADFKSWSRLLFRTIEADRLRSYMTTLAESTWDLTVWLQHYTDAGTNDVEVVLHATGHFIGVYAQLLVANNEATRCPSCGSYRLESASNHAADGVTWIEKTACAACGWESGSDAAAAQPRPAGGQADSP
jgi:hypothetical protein